MFKFFKNSFLFQLCFFTIIYFLAFSPTANILFSLPKNIKATDLSSVSETATTGVAGTICAATAAAGLSSGTSAATAASAIAVPVADTPAASGAWSQSVTNATNNCTASWGDKIYKFVMDALKYAAITTMHKLLSDLTNQIIQCINTYDPTTSKCENGSSLIVSDFSELFDYAADVAGAKFLEDLTGYNLCSITPSVNLQIALLPVAEFKDRAACTLSEIVENIDDFYNDFSNGGWAVWKESMKPNNNAFGLWLEATNEKLAKEYATMQNTEKDTGKGFKPTKKCTTARTPYKYTGSAYPASEVKCDSNGAATIKSSGDLIGSCTEVDPSTLDADGTDCAASLTTTASGTVEASVNFAALSPVRELESSLAGIYSSLGPFGPYITAISNALLNKIISTGLSSLMSAITEEEMESYSDPYQDVIDSTASESSDYSEASGEQGYANMILTVLENMKTILTDTILPYYSELISTMTSIKDYQDKIINEFWAIGSFGDATATITSGPTTVTSISGTVTTSIITTIYDVSQGNVGSATITKTETIISDSSTGGSTTTTTYTLSNKKDKIEDTDGIITSYQTKYNSLSYSNSQIDSATGPTQTAYDEITNYLSIWNETDTDSDGDGTSDAEEAKTVAIDTTNSAIPYIQAVIPSSSTTLSDLSSEITNAQNTIQDDYSAEIQNNTESTYEDYLADVQDIYNTLQHQ